MTTAKPKTRPNGPVHGAGRALVSKDDARMLLIRGVPAAQPW